MSVLSGFMGTTSAIAGVFWSFSLISDSASGIGQSMAAVASARLSAGYVVPARQCSLTR